MSKITKAVVSQEMAIARIKRDIAQRELNVEEAKANRSDSPIISFGRRHYWEGYVDAKKEDLRLLEAL